MSPLDRRSFLGALPALTLAVGGGGGWVSAPRPHRGPRPDARALESWGVQLYTLRSLLARDLDGTLGAVAEIGYRTVELAGLHGFTPRELRRRLDAVGLRAASSHASVGDVRERWGSFVEGAVELGQELVVVPSIPGEERTAEGLRRLADEFDRAGEVARASGLRFGYHNHDWELRPLADGTRPMDLLLERTDPGLVDWQMDLFWTVHGGGDPAEYLRRARGRVTSVHVKDRTADGRMVDVGDGVIDFATLLPRAEGQGLLHAFVEHDQPDDPIGSVRRSFRHLSSL